MNSLRYESFKSSESWSSRMVWTGLFCNERRADLNVLKFLRELSPFASSSINDVNAFWKLVKDVSHHYRNWCQNKDEALTEEELEALSYHFVGCIGEYFFYKLFEKHNTLFIDNKLYTFNYVCPRLDDEKDYGVDLTGVVSDNCSPENKECALQVKFWNPNSKDFQMTYDCLSRVYTDAVLNGFIDHTQDRNIFVCWLNDDSQVSKALRMSPLFPKIVFIGKKVLDININKKHPEFWNQFLEELRNL